MTFKDLLTTYWSQVTLILIAIGSLIFYFIKRHYDNSSKKIEINHSLFQQYKLKTVNDFFTNYTRAETMWSQIAIWEILARKVDAKEIDKIIFPTLNDLKKSLFELKIYFKKEEHKYFDELVNGIYEINGKVSELYFDYDEEKKDIHKANEFIFFKSDVLNKNNKIIDNICLIIGDTYKT
jgi:hypothetical protein